MSGRQKRQRDTSGERPITAAATAMDVLTEQHVCRGSENVLAASILFAMAHNPGWLHSRIQNGKLEEHLYELKETA